jgi:hypothetical protein
MTGPTAPTRQEGSATAFATLEVAADDPSAAIRIAATFGEAGLAHLFLFAAPETDLAGLAADLARAMPGLPVSGCTTAGEIGAEGYVNGRILAMGLPSRHFATRSVLIEGLGALDRDDLSQRIVSARLRIGGDHPGKSAAFAFLLVDGLSLREDILAAAIAPALGELPLFGGSAGDGVRFDRTFLAHDGRALQDAAILTLVATDLRSQVFSVNHLRPTATRMVVTGAEPERRLVREINAEPAGREYARIVGKDPDELEEMTFAAHPVVVRLGGRHHVRAIQRVTPEGDLVFFSAIEEGMVLTMAEPEDIASHLDDALRRLSAAEAPLGILACDCVLRRIEAERNQQGRAVSQVLARHGVRGFCTYGEQIGPMHLNQTMTGVALFPARPEDAA